MSLFDHLPVFNIEDAVYFAQKFYGLHVRAKPLPSEHDQNFLLQGIDGVQFVLKIANGTEERTILEAQNQAMRHLGEYVQFCPRVLPALSGQEIVAIKSTTGEQHFLRLVTYLIGTPLGNIERHSAEILRDIGFKLGQLTEALRSFDYPAFHRDFYRDLANGPVAIKKSEPLIQEPEMHQHIQQLHQQFERSVTPLLPLLRKSIIHNDANNFNLLVGGGADLYSRNQYFLGLIDFGDTVYSYAISDFLKQLLDDLYSR